MATDNKSVIKNSIWLIAESILTMLISLCVGVISARYLGPSNYGLIGRFAPFISLANSIATFGMQSIIIRNISRDPSGDNVRKVMGSSLLFRFVLSFSTMVCIDVYAYIIAQQEDPLLFTVALLQSISLIFHCYEIITFYFHATLLSKYIAISTVVTSVVVGAWKIALLICKASVVWFALSTTLQAFVMFLLCFILFKKNFKHKLKFDGKLLKGMVGDSSHLLLASMGIAIYGQVDQIMIGSILGNTHLGYYTAAYTIATMWYFVPQAIANSLRSKIFATDKNSDDYSKNVRVLFLIITILGIAAGIGITLLSKPFIFILYGEDYLQANSTLMILSWCGLFANIGTARSIWLVGKDLHKYSKYFALMGAAVNVIVNAVLIPLLGINGAAIATVFSQFFVQFICPLIFKPTRPILGDMVGCYRAFPLVIEMFKEFILSIKNKRNK